MGSRTTSGSGRGNLRDITNAMQASGPPPAEIETVPVLPVKEVKKARPLSMMVRAMSSGVDKPTTPPSIIHPTETRAETAEETKSDKRVSTESLVNLIV